MFLRRALTYYENATRLPRLTRIGAVPSGPPPLGNIVALVAVRLFRDTGGNRRRPGTLYEWKYGRNGCGVRTFFDYKRKIAHLLDLLASLMFYLSND